MEEVFNIISLFKKKESKTCPIKIQKEGINFIVDEVTDAKEKQMTEIANIYPSKVDTIAQYMLDNGICLYFGNLTKQEVIDALGTPTIRLEEGQIDYCEQEFDEHMISIEFSGILDKFSNFSIYG